MMRGQDNKRRHYQHNRREVKLTKVKINFRVMLFSVSMRVALSGSQDPEVLVMFGCRFISS